MCDKYMDSTVGQQINYFQINETKDLIKEKKNNFKSYTLVYKTDYCRQLRTVLWRSLLTTIREPEISRIRIIQTFV